MVDDGLVDKEKIGGSNYFWSFPAKKDRLMQIQYQKTLDQIENLKVVLQETNAKLLDAKRSREDDEDTTDQMEDTEMKDTGNNDGNNETSDEKQPKTKMTRTMKLQRLNEIALEKSKLLNEINILKENDPQVVADLEKELNFVKEAANRWTDNIFNCKSYLIKKRNMDKKEAHRVLGITDAFDCKYYKAYIYISVLRVFVLMIFYFIKFSFDT